MGVSRLGRLLEVLVAAKEVHVQRLYVRVLLVDKLSVFVGVLTEAKLRGLAEIE